MAKIDATTQSVLWEVTVKSAITTDTLHVLGRDAIIVAAKAEQVRRRMGWAGRITEMRRLGTLDA